MSIRSLVAYVAFAACAAQLSVADEREDYTVTEEGTMTFPSPVSYGTLRNAASSGAVVFDQSAYEKSPAFANSFTNFDAVVGATTLFLGGWWDFGATADEEINFFAKAATASNRTTVFDGAVVTNVGFAYIAGSDGTGNTLILTNGADLTVGNLSFGSKKQDANGKLLMTSGSSLTCRGNASMSDYSNTSSDIYKYKTGNLWEVSGTNTTLSVGGMTYIGVPLGVDYYPGTTGGNTFSVTDGAKADLGDFRVSTGARHGSSNRVEFARGAKVTMRSFAYDSSSFTVNQGRFGANRVSILDGAVVTNTGVFTFGTDFIESGMDELIISNATFHTDSFVNYGGGYALMRGYRSRFVLSGPRARLTFNNGYNLPFGNSDSSPGGCTYLVENLATNEWRGYSNGYFAYTRATHNQTVWVRDGAMLLCPKGICTTHQGGETSTNNTIIVEHGATLKSDLHMGIEGRQGSLLVDDGIVDAVMNLYIGGAGSNCLARVRGSNPKMTVSWNIDVKNDSCLRFELPATGYEFATKENPLIDVGRSSGGLGVFVDSTSRLELTGAKELLAYHQEHNIKREYVLIKANSGGINLPEEWLESMQAQLPPGVTISIQNEGGGYFLILSVKPLKGLVLIVR